MQEPNEPKEKRKTEKRRTVVINGERFTASPQVLAKLHFVFAKSDRVTADYDAVVGTMTYNIVDGQPEATAGRQS